MLMKKENLVDPRKLPGYCGDQDIDEICSRIEGIGKRSHIQSPNMTKNGRRRSKAIKSSVQSCKDSVPKPACEDRHEEAPPGSHVASVEDEKSASIDQESMTEEDDSISEDEEFASEVIESIEQDPGLTDIPATGEKEVLQSPADVQSKCLKIPNPFAGTKQRTDKLKTWFTLRSVGSPEDHRNMRLRKTKVKESKKAVNLQDIKFLDAGWDEFMKTKPDCYQPKKNNAKKL